MLKVIARAALFWILTASTSGQSGAQFTLPPSSRQEGLVPFANNCPASQTYKISAGPLEHWLGVEPAAVDAGPNSSFAVRKASSEALKFGTYRSTVMVVCASCAASEPPCMQSAHAGAFTPAISGTPATPWVAPEAELASAPLILPALAPQSNNRTRLFSYIALGMLAIGLLGAVVALHGLIVGRAPHRGHQVRR